MPRNSSGVYTQPSSTSAVSGATIDPDAFNTLISDIGSELTGSLPVNGSTGMTSPLKLPNGTVSSPSAQFTSATSTGIYKTTNGLGFAVGGTLYAELTTAGWLDGSGTAYQLTPTIAWTDIASATTTDIGAVANINLRVTGTTTITGLGTSASGTQRTLRFAGALTFTHNGTSLILPGAASITTAANDTATMISLGSGNWICTEFKRASGKAISRDVTSVAAGNGLSGGTITSTGTLSIDTDNALGIGAHALLQNNTGSPINSGTTTAGNNLNVATFNSSGALIGGSALSSGQTWRNVSGSAVIASGFGLWIRTA